MNVRSDYSHHHLGIHTGTPSLLFIIKFQHGATIIKTLKSQIMYALTLPSHERESDGILQKKHPWEIVT